jgi:hypothetical protein
MTGVTLIVTGDPLGSSPLAFDVTEFVAWARACRADPLAALLRLLKSV